ncbi:MAG: discoidin domain-containing protein, partial [bacterium]
VRIDDLELVELPPPGAPRPDPVVSASSTLRGHEPSSVLEGGAGWAPDAGDGERWIALDFGDTREYGGLIIDWERPAADYVVEASDDGDEWRALRTVRGGNGGRDYHYLPESESRRLRVRLLGAPEGPPPRLMRLFVQPLEWSATREAFFAAIARDAPRGCYPRGISGEQSYWTVVGLDGDTRESLFNEDGMIETGPERFSLEPFLFWNGRLVTWADVDLEASLAAGFLPLPTVTWVRDDVRLTIEPVAIGESGASSVSVRYTVRNTEAGRARGSLFLALRPFQTNPPSQTLNTIGGTARIREMRRDGDAVLVNGERAVICATPPDSFGAVSFDGGDIVVDHLRRGVSGPAAPVQDPFEAASGALAWTLDLAAGTERAVDIVFPLHPGGTADRAGLTAARERARSEWESRLGRVTFDLPPSARELEETLKAQLGWILVNRAGPALQPGARAYARSWIRDGSLTSSALLRLGHADVVREFINWYAPHQYDDGKVPCVVDRRGADPVPEHDSHGEFIFLVAEYWRYTGDRTSLELLWPWVAAAAGYLDTLRQQRRTPEWEGPERREFWGILPPSISHEGYSAK